MPTNVPREISEFLTQLRETENRLPESRRDEVQDFFTQLAAYNLAHLNNQPARTEPPLSAVARLVERRIEDNFSNLRTIQLQEIQIYTLDDSRQFITPILAALPLHGLNRETMRVEPPIPMPPQIANSGLFRSPQQQSNQAIVPQVGLNSHKLAEIKFSDEDIPEQYKCPLSLEIMTEPVYVKQHPNQRFEKSWILRHLQRHRTNPLTREPLTQADLIDDRELKKEINEFVETQINAKQAKP